MYGRTGAQPKAEPVTASRVEMLLAIYDAAIQATDRVIEAIVEERPHDSALARSQAIVLIGLIESGLDLSQGEIPHRIKDLCCFAEQALLKSSEPEIRSARNVLQNLRDGFAGVKEEAIKLEESGSIPQLARTSAIDTIV